MAKRPPLLATYRLQLNAQFTLNDARAQLPYLAKLGVSHVYCSPILAARQGSTHGYDVTDPTHISDALGGEAAFVALADGAHALGMGILLDIVPNHMGICADNPYWDDVLMNGQSSRFAEWFDVSWKAGGKKSSRILLPVLGDALENVIARGELVLESGQSGTRIRYFGHHFPINPASVPDDFTIADYSKPDRLAPLLAKQHYRLAFWRVGERDLNYRRFFDVNDLISLRVERNEVFEATHRVVIDLVNRGLVDAFRVDHIDGLLEPRRYLERLRNAVGGDVPIFVEKILAYGESLPADWPVDGTTGYEFLTAVDDLLVHPDGLREIESRYRRNKNDSFDNVAVDSKRRVLRTTLNPDVRRVAPMLAALAKEAGWLGNSIADYAKAIIEAIAHLSVYRTYVDAEHATPNEHDSRVLREALRQARSEGHVATPAVDALARALFDKQVKNLEESRLAFVLRFQQLSGPAAAKGVEDTALYSYAPLSARSEVGGAPSTSVEHAGARLHELLRERARRMPQCLNATNTHDTKRSADARARIIALTEHSAQWQRATARWVRRHKTSQRLVAGRLAPNTRVQDFMYQALLAVWPAAGSRDLGDHEIEALQARLTDYMIKATREAKVGTNWVDPNAGYESAIANFVKDLMNRQSNGELGREMDQLVALLSPAARWNMIARLVLHHMSPGVPDIYQGDELWYQALVDPDNRRPVDFQDRARMLGEIEHIPKLGALRGHIDPSGLKMFASRALLEFRQSNHSLFETGSYTPLRASGKLAAHVFAFRRESAEGREAVVIVARHLSALGDLPVGAVWQDTFLGPLDGSTEPWHTVMENTVLPATAGQLCLGDVFATLPAAVLTRQPVPKPIDSAIEITVTNR